MQNTKYNMLAWMSTRYILAIIHISFLAISASLCPFFNLSLPFLGSLGYNNRIMDHLCPPATDSGNVSGVGRSGV